MKQPNIVLIIADDLGHWTLGCEGNADAVTPHIDRLAREGMQLRRFYCSSPVCSPARASLYTGLMPSAHGVADWLRLGNVNAGGDTAVEYLRGHTCYTQHLAQAGYVCGLSGKWHLGDSQRPQQGFSHWYCHQRGGGPYYNAPMVRDGQLIAQEGYLTDAITQDACRFIREQAGAGRPFYAHVGYTAPHTPWLNNHPKEYTDLFADCRFDSCPILPAHPDQLPYDQFADDRSAMLQGYFASVAAMDAGIGDILATLEAAGELDNTIVVFTSDNGFNCGHHGIWGKGNGTYPFNMYESSVRVPFIVRAPGRVPQGRISHSVLSACDWYATVLELAGIAPQGAGRSFADVLTGQAERPQAEACVYDEYGATRMLIKGQHKYVKRYPDGPNLLFDLGRDPNEERNLIDTAPQDLVAALDAHLENWFALHTLQAADSRYAGVRGFGQDKPHGPDGFPEGAFRQEMYE